jgi:hypothetical protein
MKLLRKRMKTSGSWGRAADEVYANLSVNSSEKTTGCRLGLTDDIDGD